MSLEGDREATSIAATLGRGLRSARLARRLTQAQVGARIGISHGRYGDLDRGHGAGAPLGLWIAASHAVGQPLSVALSRGPDALPRDAGHLGGQELILRLARQHGTHRSFELPTRPADPSRSIDVGLRDDRHRSLLVIEIANRIEDLGASTRSFRRKLAEAEQLAVAIGGDSGPYRVAGCWVLRSTASNRALVARFPAIIEAQFPGSSRRWADALTSGADAPVKPGLVWVNLGGTRVYERRSARSSAG